MSNEAREYPVRIHAGHQGGGRRTWKPELFDETERQFSCEYVRGDVAADMLAALRDVYSEVSGFSDYQIDRRYDAPLARRFRKIRAAITKAEGRTP